MAAAFNWQNGSDFSGANSNTGTSMTVGTTHAAGSNGTVTVGDLLVIAVTATWNTSADANSLVLADVTYTQAYGDANTSNGMAIGVWWKIATLGDTGVSSVSWTHATQSASWAVADWTGIDASPSDAAAGAFNSGFPTSIAAPTVSPVGANDLLICVWGMCGGKGAYTCDAAMTSRVDTGSISSNIAEIVLADQQLSAAGATGTRTTTEGSGSPGYGVSLTFKVASSVVPVVPSVTLSIPPSPSEGAMPILGGEGAQVWANQRIKGLINSVLALIQMAVCNATKAPAVLADGTTKLSRYPWWPVAGQTADGWVYYDQAGAIWRFTSTAPTSTH